MKQINPKVIETLIQIAQDPHEKFKMHMKQARDMLKKFKNDPVMTAKINKVIEKIESDYKVLSTQ